MLTEVRLGSNVPNGLGGPESAGISLIYSFMLEERGQGFYRRVGVVQIGEDVEEFVKNEKEFVHVTIRFQPKDEKYLNHVDARNEAILEVIHFAMLRLAEYDGKLNKQALYSIRQEMLSKSFLFNLPLRRLTKVSVKNGSATLMVSPRPEYFEYWLQINTPGEPEMLVPLYKGMPSTHYVLDFFDSAKWAGKDKIVVKGKIKEVELHVLIQTKQVDVINLTPYPKPPLFELFKADILPGDKEKAYADWLHSLPPSEAAMLRRAVN